MGRSLKAETHPVWRERYGGAVLLVAARAHDRPRRVQHIIRPRLREFLTRFGVDTLDLKFDRVDVGELGSVAVTSTGDAFLVVVVVIGREQVSKDEGGDVHVVLLVFDDGYGGTVVGDGDTTVDVGDVDTAHGVVSPLVVEGIDKNLVDDLVEARWEVKLYRAGGCPYDVWLDGARANVGVGA